MASDDLDPVTQITHSFASNTMRTFDYDSTGNRKRTQRDDSNGDVFAYNLSDQVNGVQLNVANPARRPLLRPISLAMPMSCAPADSDNVKCLDLGLH